MPTTTDDPDMVFISLSSACELVLNRSTNRSGIGKTSTEDVRDRLRYEPVSRLADSRRFQATRPGPLTAPVTRLYRADLV